MHRLARRLLLPLCSNLAGNRSAVVVHRCLATGAASGSTEPSFIFSADAADRLISGQPALLLPEDGAAALSFGDLGLAQTWWPSDFALSAMELLHTDACLPWWACALSLGFAVRLVLVHPSLTLFRLAQKQQILAQQQQQQQQQSNQPAGRIAKLTEQLRNARAANNVAESHRLARELRATATLTEAARESAPPGGLASLAVGFACQIGWLASHLACLRAMATAAAVPVPGMQAGGPTDWLADLTCSDPTGVAPVLITGILLLNAQLAAATAAAQPGAGKAATGGGFAELWESGRPLAMALGPAVFFTFLVNCPSVLLFYFGATGFVAMATNLGLYLSAVRRSSGAQVASARK